MGNVGDIELYTVLFHFPPQRRNMHSQFRRTQRKVYPVNHFQLAYEF